MTTNRLPEIKKIKIKSDKIKTETAGGISISSIYGGSVLKYGSVFGDETLMLKKSDTYKDMASMEIATNQIASSIFKIEVPKFYEVKDEYENEYFGSVDFTTNADSQREVVHFERVMPEFPIDWSCEGIIKKINEISDFKEKDINSFIKILMFDAVIGNDDRHSKNLAFLKDGYKIGLSPCYDNCPSVVFLVDKKYEINKDDSVAGVISVSNECGDNVTNYVTELVRLGYKSDVINLLKSINELEISKIIDDRKLGDRGECFKNFVSSNIKKWRSLCEK